VTAAEILDAARERLAECVPPSTMELWLWPIRALEISEGQLVCTAPAAQFAWIARRYAKPLGDAVRSVSDLEGVIVRPV
jgi:hypothetical protein